MRPIIGITSILSGDQKYTLSYRWASSLKPNGAAFVMLPYELDSIQDYLKLVSGIILTGGGDIDSRHFGEPRHEKSGEPVAVRDEFELALCKAAIAADIPLFGICRGMQVMNVALGGNLCQHIDGHLHNAPYRTEYIHDIKIMQGSKLHQIIGRSGIRVNSIHHQCIGNRLGNGVSVSAITPDGIVEGIEVAANRFAIGVQWHPEDLSWLDSHNAALFRAFAEAAKQ